MAKTEHYYTRFEAGCFYHVYNCTVDKKKLFANTDNYFFFLRRYNDYLSGVVDTYVYNLLGNHFHLLLRVKSLAELTLYKKMTQQDKQPKKDIVVKPDRVHDIVSHQFKKFFQSYAMAFNKQQERTGTLFQTPFKRAKIDSNYYLKSCVRYIHTNAQKHGLVKDFRDYPWSSYHSYLSQKPTKLHREQAIEWFVDLIGFLEQHNQMPEDTQKDWHLE